MIFQDKENEEPQNLGDACVKRGDNEKSMELSFHFLT